MRTSSLKTTAAVLRQKSGTKEIAIKDVEWAKMLGRSVQAIHNIESGRTKVTHELAKRMFHETGISIDWLMKGDPTVPPISERGEPYTREIYERTQAQKTPLKQPHPMYRHYDKLDFCARLIAILESASARKDYYMARYKVHTALDSLRREFGMDEKVYQHSAPNDVNNSMAVAAPNPMAIAALKEVLARDEEIESFWEQARQKRRISGPKPKKKQSSKKRQ